MALKKTPHATIDEILNSRKVVIACGTGGVGKTTLSAAIAMRAALLGKKTVVITIDPAKRLATSLGMARKDNLSDQPTEITGQLRKALSSFPGLAAQAGKTGTLHAIVPDSQKTFERFFTELSPNAAVAQRVLDNPIYKIFSQEYSGANEYMALERLYFLYRSGEYDCIVLDTPPSRNTLAFLQAPKLLARLFEERFIRWLVLPANKLVSTGMKKALGILEKLTGAGFMTHLLEFASSLFEMRARFTTNLKKITDLLESPEVGFIMVTNAAPDGVTEALHFVETLKEHRFRFDGIALNRLLESLPKASKRDLKPDSAADAEDPGLRAGLEILSAVQKRERSVIMGFEKQNIPICAKLPELARDVHSVEDLLHVALALDRNPGSDPS